MEGSEKVLFHYTSLEGLLGIIESRSIWATNILYLNDASELNYSLNLLKEIILKFQKGPQNVLAPEYRSHIFFTKIIERIYQYIPSETFAFFVCSFSEEEDLLSQWRGYCPAGIGFSLGFVFSKLCAWAQKNKCKLKPCIYDAEEQKKELMNLIKQISSKYETEIIGLPPELMDEEEIKLGVNFLFKFAEMAPTFKHPKFKEEKEWRAIADRDLKWDIETIRYRNGRSMVVPYIEIPLPLKNKVLDIDQIMVGPTHDPTLSKASLEMLLKSKKVKYNKIYYSTIPYRTW